VNALANAQVGDLVNRNFASTYVKVGTFDIVNGRKQGGNVASYFCLPDGRVLHAIAGPVDANQFASEVRWAVAAHKQAAFRAPHDPRYYQELMRRAHADRLHHEYRIDQAALGRLHQLAEQADSSDDGPTEDRGLAAKLSVLKRQRKLANAGRMHLMLALFPLPRVEDVYKFVFEDVLREKVTALPVVEK